MSTVKICEHDVAEQECPYCKHKTHYDLVIELQATIEQQAAKIAKLEDRIRVADAEKPSYKTNIVPDSQCKQSKCANATTGCVGYCKLDELSKGLSVTMSATLTEA